AYHGDSPSTRTASATYSRFCATATRSNGAAPPATSNTLEKAYFLRSSLSSIVPFSYESSEPMCVLYGTAILPCGRLAGGRRDGWYHSAPRGQRKRRGPYRLGMPSSSILNSKVAPPGMGPRPTGP